MRYSTYFLTNRSKRSCTLKGVPSVQFVRGRDVVPFRFHDGGTPYLPKRLPETILVPPGARASFVVAKYRCDVGIQYLSTGMRVAVPGSESDSLTLRWQLRTSTYPYCQPVQGDPASDPGNTVAVSPVIASTRDLLGK